MNEKSPPFDQSVISIAHAWEYLKKEKSIRGQLNNQTTKQPNNQTTKQPNNQTTKQL